MSLIAAAPASRAAFATSAENVSAETGTPVVASPSSAGARAAISTSGGTGGPLRAATAPTSSMSKPASASALPSRTACSGVPLRAPSNIESSVTLTIPAASGRARSRARSLSRHCIVGYGSDRTVALSSVYTDLDGTLLGKGSSLFRDAEGAFSLAQARGLEACQRAGIEVVIMSGRREPQVHEAARLMGQSSYIYEAGCAFAIDGETTLMTGEMAPDESGTIYEQIEQRGIPKRLFEHFEGRLEYHAPWHHGRVLSHLFRGKVDLEEANAVLAKHGGDDLRLLDNGAIGREMASV